MFGDDGMGSETEGMTVREAYFDTGLKINHLTVELVTVAAIWVSWTPMAALIQVACKPFNAHKP